MSYIKSISKAVLYGTANGVLFYIIGGMAAPYLPTISAPIAAVIGFVTAAGIALQSSFDE